MVVKSNHCQRFATVVPFGMNMIREHVVVFFLEVWRALLKEMPLQSVLKILGKMTSNKILEPESSETQAVCDRIQSETALKKVGLSN